MNNVLITGASRGLGLALARKFYHSYWGVYLVVRTESAKVAVSEKLPDANILVSDVTCDEYESKLGPWLGEAAIDVLINNAGTVTKDPTLGSTQAEYLRKEFDTHCVSALSTVKGSLDALKQSPQPIIINISSRRGSMKIQSELKTKGSGVSYSYRIGKAAQNMLTLCLADELEDMNIKVVAIHPGRLLTRMGWTDAHIAPSDSAKKIVQLVEANQLKHRDYVCLETGTLPW